MLGGGVGGLVAAHEQRKRLPSPHRVVLIERSLTHLFLPSLLWLMIGQRKPSAIGKPLPKSGVFAHGQTEVVAHNLAVAITGKGEARRFEGYGECFVEMGDGKAGFAHGNFYVEPAPTVKMYTFGPHWHTAKVLFEKDWWRRWF